MNYTKIVWLASSIGFAAGALSLAVVVAVAPVTPAGKSGLGRCGPQVGKVLGSRFGNLSKLWGHRA